MPSALDAPPRILVDVDVVLDVLARRELFFADSAAVLAACETGRCRGVVAAHTITTLHYLLSRHHDEAHARVHITDLLRIVKVARVDSTVIQHALAADLPDFEDAVQMAAAVVAGAQYVVTRNLPHFAGGPLPALQPAELLSLLDP
jgi:predicted nucleic acid-binding protein